LRRCCRRGWLHPRGLRRRVFRFFLRLSSCFGVRFFFGHALNLFAHFLRDVSGNGARVRLLFRYAIPRQQVNDGFRLDLQFTGQFVDSDLIYVGHALRSRLRLRLFCLRRIAFIAGGRGLGIDRCCLLHRGRSFLCRFRGLGILRRL